MKIWKFLSVGKIAFPQIFSDRNFRDCIVFCAFFLKLAGYHTVLGRKHSYNHVRCTSSFSKRKLVKPSFFSVFLLVIIVKSFPNHHYVANVCWRLTFSLSIRHLNSKDKFLVLILANSTLRPSQSINQGSSKIEKRVLLVNFYNYIFYCYTQNKTFLHSTLWECSSRMRDVTSTKTTSFLDESNIVTEIWNLDILGIYIKVSLSPIFAIDVKPLYTRCYH